MKNPFQRNKRRFYALENRIIFMEAALETYFDSPTYIDSDAVGFNGQKIRKAIFNELCDTFSFQSIIETGTYTGNTSGYMATQTGLPLSTCESNRVLVALAKNRLSGIPGVKCYAMDSRDFLNTLTHLDVSSERVFIYLDAHCHDDLPLKQEIEIICKTWKEFAIMIDDFQVPGDKGYGYDSYAGNQALSINNFLPVFLQNGLAPFFPALPSSKETGAKRGSVILTRNGNFADQVVNKCGSLKKYES
ncbi:MAG: hypothetical protein H6R15_2863 [Proteobacteria bacterium]|nr:hypothetical protein [Pseudomonadota bacterium]